MMLIILNVAQYANVYLNYESKEHTTTDSFPETFEDKYFEVLYELYYFKKKK